MCGKFARLVCLCFSLRWQAGFEEIQQARPDNQGCMNILQLHYTCIVTPTTAHFQLHPSTEVKAYLPSSAACTLHPSSEGMSQGLDSANAGSWLPKRGASLLQHRVV